MTTGTQATTQNKMASQHTSSRATTVKPAAGRPQQSRRRIRFIAGAAGTLLFGVGILQLPLAVRSSTEYTAGEPIEFVVTASDTLEIPFEGSNTAALGISLQQCTGDAYLQMEIMYNDSTISTTKITTNQCNRIIAGDNYATDMAITTDQLCAFRTSAAVIQGYTTETVILNETTYITPTDITVKLQNRGDTSASGQLVFFTEDYPAPNVDDSIDRVNTIAELDENTYTVKVDFTASASDEESFCSTETGCALYAYYVEVDSSDDADLTFGTTCQAETGSLIYDTVVTTENTATMANSAYQVTACLQLPANIEADYRVYLVLSPDTTSYARVGYGIQDQVIFASDILEVNGDADVECPEEVSSDSSSGAIRTITPAGRATGAIALSLAAAAGHAAARSEL